jgi:hypothetical protein
MKELKSNNYVLVIGFSDGVRTCVLLIKLPELTLKKLSQMFYAVSLMRSAATRSTNTVLLAFDSDQDKIRKKNI